MINKLYVLFSIILFLYFIYHCCSIEEGFTPQEVENIIQPPGSYTIGSIDPAYIKQTQLLTVSNGYTKDMINNLRPSNPEPFDKETTDSLGDFPGAGQERDALSATEFEYPNDYKFTVEYKCRKTATGMFSDCGTYSANTAWTADPYKGLNCPLSNTKSPKSPKSPKETKMSTARREAVPRDPSPKYGIGSVGNSPLY